nr:proteoglycan 4-like [Ipomoea batatas]
MASQQQQARPMFRFASMLRPAGAPPAPPAAAPQPMFRPPVAAPFRPPPPQTRDPSPPQRPPTAPAPAPAPPPPTAPAPPQPVAPPPVQPRFTVGAPPPAPEPRPAATIPSAPPKSPAAAIPAVQDPTRPFQLYQAPKPATSSSSSRSPPTPSPKNLETNEYSPKVKPVSPLKLPPEAQFKPEAEVEPRIPAEIDQKTVVVQQRSERNKATAQKLNATQRKRSDTEEPLGMSILTLAGENKGAMMELSPAAPANKHGFNGNPRRLQSEGDNSGKESDEEGKSSRMGPKGTTDSLPMTAFMNSNVQGVNNSVLHNASCNHHDPWCSSRLFPERVVAIPRRLTASRTNIMPLYPTSVSR